MSDTPRTDRTDLYDYQTAVDFARELERENNALRADCRNCCLKSLVLRHIKLDGRFRIKRNPARSALAGMTLVEKEYAPGKWREYGIVSADEFVPQNGAGESPAPIGAGSTLPAGSSAQAANQKEAHPPHSSDAQRRTNAKLRDAGESGVE